MAKGPESKKNLWLSLFDREAYRNNYWRLGFRTRLYDLFTPRAYSESLERAAAHVPMEGGLGLDAGCGSGQLIPLLAARVAGLRYLGADKLPEGLTAARRRARSLPGPPRAHFLRWDMTAGPPLAAAHLDWVVAHFSVYVIAERHGRLAAWRHLHAMTKPGGRLIASNPSSDYSADGIIRHSLDADRARRGRVAAWLKGLLIAPVTRKLGLGYIERQLREGRFHAYTLEEFREELETAGWCVETVETVYAGSGFLLIARRG